MDLYTRPADALYITGVSHRFRMPTGNTTRPAVAVTKDEGELWNSAYTLLVVLMFPAIGKLINDMLLALFPLQSNGNRIAMLVAHYNNADPFSGTFMMGNYVRKMVFKSRRESEFQGVKRSPIDWATVFLALVLFGVQASLFASNIVAGLLIPAHLQVGRVARVQPSAIFYFDKNQDQGIEPDENLMAELKSAQNRFSQVASTRALGYVQQSRDALKKKVNFDYRATRSASADVEDQFSFSYGYDISGSDFGLQRAPELIQKVTGYCETRSGWYKPELSNSSAEIYSLWDEDNEGVIPSDGRLLLPDPALPPSMQFYPRIDWTSPTQDVIVNSNNEIEYAIIPDVAGRESRYAITNDVWYSTERDNSTGTNVIRRGRPALGCREKLSWHFHGTEVPTAQLWDVSSLHKQLSKFWWGEVFQREFSHVSKVAEVGAALGVLSLAELNAGFLNSRGIVTNAGNSTIDLERVILTAFVASREVVRNTALMHDLDHSMLSNLAAYNEDFTAPNADNRVPDERADFLLETSDVTTMSVRVLISIPCIVLSLWVIVILRRPLLGLSNAPASNEGMRSRYLARSTALSAAQLYRMLDEEIVGKRRWDGRMSATPYLSNMSTKNQNVIDQGLKPANPFDIIPVSAQINDGQEPLNLEHVPKEVYDEVLQRNAHVKPLDCPRRDSNGYKLQQAIDLEKGVTQVPPPRCSPIVDNFIVPKIVPIYEHVNPEDAVGGSQKAGQHAADALKADPTGAGKLATTRSLKVVDNAYELVMTYGYRSQLKLGRKDVGWKEIIKTADLPPKPAEDAAVKEAAGPTPATPVPTRSATRQSVQKAESVITVEEVDTPEPVSTGTPGPAERKETGLGDEKKLG